MSKATNGVRVASESGHGETATVAVTINAGSRHGAAGASHLLQHLAFSGKSRNAIDGMGGHFKATSSREHTVYTAKVLKKDIAAAVSVLAEAAQFAAHDDAAVAFASKSADSGNHSYKSSVVDELHQAAFLGTDLGRSALFDGDAAACSAADLNAFVDAGVGDDLIDLLDDEEEVEATLDRAGILIRSGHFPTDPTGRRWPWPIV